MQSEEIVIWAEFAAHPRGAEDLLDFLAHTAQRARTETGCIGYDVYRDSEGDIARFFMHERWRDKEALASHRALPYVQSFKRDIAPLLAQPYVVQVLRTTGR